jgi:metal-responsive CopG/Arc/MetJ family transcriptional regulator
MSKSIRVIRKYVRKTRPPERGTFIGVRLQRDALEQLDAWIAKRDDAPSRPEAIRRLLAKALGKK